MLFIMVRSGLHLEMLSRRKVYTSFDSIYWCLFKISVQKKGKEGGEGGRGRGRGKEGEEGGGGEGKRERKGEGKGKEGGNAFSILT